MMQPRTYVAYDTDRGIEILVIVYEDTVHVATRKHPWETWGVPLTSEERPS